MIGVTAKKRTEPNAAPVSSDDLAEHSDNLLAGKTSNPWDRVYAHGEHPPSTLEPTPVEPAEVGHIGHRTDPTPREDYTVAGQVAKTKEA